MMEVLIVQNDINKTKISFIGVFHTKKQKSRLELRHPLAKSDNSCAQQLEAFYNLSLRMLAIWYFYVDKTIILYNGKKFSHYRIQGQSF